MTRLNTRCPGHWNARLAVEGNKLRRRRQSPTAVRYNRVLFNSCTASCNNLYRATRTHSADYATARSLYVRLSHAGILSKRLNISSKFFFTSGSQTILVFPHQTGWIRRGRASNGGVECKGYEKITIFDHYLALSRK